MGNRSPFHLTLISVLLLLGGSVATPGQQKEKPALKNFGSSLKQLKWDPVRNMAVLTNPDHRTKTDSDDVDIVRVETSLVVNDVLVLDARGQPVPGLTAADFIISEDGKPQQVGMFSLGDTATVPRSIVLIMDYSGSLFPYINMSVDAAKTLVDKLHPNDRMAIVTDDIKLIVNFTQDKAELKSKLESLKKKARGNDARRGWFRKHSLQFSSLLATLRELFDDEDLRPVVIFQTDGDELGLLPPQPANTPASMRRIARDFSINDVYRAAEKSKATIYTVIPGVKLIGLPEAEQRDRLQDMATKSVMLDQITKHKPPIGDLMNKRAISGVVTQLKEVLVAQQSALAVLSTITGAWASFLEDPSEAGEIYSRIFSDINRRYLIGYYPTNKEHDGKRRRVGITIRDHPEYVVMYRRWYFAPNRDE